MPGVKRNWGAAFLLACFLAGGCGPTIKKHYYYDLDLDCYHTRPPLLEQRLVVADITDARPFDQKVHPGAVLADIVLVPLSLGTICLFNSNADLNYHAIKNVDDDIPDLLADCVKKKHLFSQVDRKKMSPTDIDSTLSLLRHEGIDYVLTGRITNLYGDFKIGEEVGRREAPLDPFVEYYAEYDVLYSYGTVNMEMRLIETGTGKTAWGKTYAVKAEHSPNLNVLKNNARKKLAIRALDKALEQVMTDLEAWAAGDRPCKKQ